MVVPGHFGHISKWRHWVCVFVRWFLFFLRATTDVMEQRHHWWIHIQSTWIFWLQRWFLAQIKSIWFSLLRILKKNWLILTHFWLIMILTFVIVSVLPEHFSWKSRSLCQKITKITSFFGQNRGKITSFWPKFLKIWPPRSFLLLFYVTIFLRKSQFWPKKIFF